MPKAIYINLAVADLSQSMNFFTGLGFAFNSQFSNDQAAALILSDTIYAMLHTAGSLQRFTRKTLADPAQVTEGLFALEVESRERVDKLLEMVIALGGREYRQAEDHDFMYTRSFEDPDGHLWEFFWMDPGRMPQS